MFAFLSHHGIRERIAGLENPLFAKMNQLPKLGSEGSGVSVCLWGVADADRSAAAGGSTSLVASNHYVASRSLTGVDNGFAV